MSITVSDHDPFTSDAPAQNTAPSIALPVVLAAWQKAAVLTASANSLLKKVCAELDLEDFKFFGKCAWYPAKGIWILSAAAAKEVARNPASIVTCPAYAAVEISHVVMEVCQNLVWQKIASNPACIVTWPLAKTIEYGHSESKAAAPATVYATMLSTAFTSLSLWCGSYEVAVGFAAAGAVPVLGFAYTRRNAISKLAHATARQIVQAVNKAFHQVAYNGGVSNDLRLAIINASCSLDQHSQRTLIDMFNLQGLVTKSRAQAHNRTPPHNLRRMAHIAPR